MSKPAATAKSTNKYDAVRWCFVGAILLAVILIDWWNAFPSTLLKVFVWLAALMLSALVAAKTAKGAQWRQFARLSISELRKVTWPSRAETTQTTWVVVLFVFVASFILWGMDAILTKVVQLVSA